MITQGQRKAIDEDGHLRLAEGEFGKCRDGKWYARPPGQHMGCLDAHEVTEHDDGSLSVSPSILITDGDTEWHGYLI